MAPTEPTVRDPNTGPAELPPRFEFGRELGRGGMGSVYAARDTVLDRDVAIKQALADDAESMRLFEREAKITAQLQHPAIVPIHDAGRDENGRPYYIMRRLEGDPLADRVARTADVKARLALVPNVLAAVDAAAFAHARGVIHRDIKPWNILIGDYGETVLIDWGLARRVDDTKSDGALATKAVGTPGYMAPEQVRGELINARADVYALGATLLHVLIGKSAVDTTPTEWMQEAAAGPAPPTDKLDDEVPAELTAIVTKAMAPVARDRYADAVEMAADLRAFLAGKLVAAHHYTTVERLARFVRRHRVAVATATAALVAIAVIAVYAIHNVVVERDHARAAQAEAADRAELNLVERASTLAAQEPTRAVALLRGLPLSSPYLLRARDIASKAAANGIAHGIHVHVGGVRSIAFSPDGRQLLSTGNDGTLQVHDLASRKSRTLVANDQALGDAVWAAGGATIVFAIDHGGLRAFDVASGKVQTLDASAHADHLYVPPSDDRVRYVDGERHFVIEQPLQPGAPPVTLARDAVFAVFDGDRFLVSGGGTVRIVDARGEHVLWRDKVIERVTSMAFSPDGVHAAVTAFDIVIEFDVMTLVEARRWPQRASTVAYLGNRLYANNRARAGVMDHLTIDTMEVAPGDWTVTWTTAAQRGVALLNQAGDVIYGDAGSYHIHRYGIDRARVIAGRPGLPYIAIGSQTGWIRWYDLQATVPRTFLVPKGAQLCAIDEQRVYITSAATGEVLLLPRHGDEVRTIRTRAFDCLIGHAGTRIAAVSGDDEWTIVDGNTGTTHPIHSRQLVTSGKSYFFVTNRRTVTELATAGERAVWTAPQDVVALAVNESWFAVTLPDNTIIRVNRQTGQTVTIPMSEPLDWLGISRDGVMWFAIGARLFRAETTARLAGTLPTPATGLGFLKDGTLIVTSQRIAWRVHEGPAGMQLTTLTENLRALGDYRTAVSIAGFNQAILKYLDTGEQVVRQTPGAIGALTDDNVLALYIGAIPPQIHLYDDPVPRDPKQLRTWIDSATNAVLEPGSDDLTWR